MPETMRFLKIRFVVFAIAICAVTAPDALATPILLLDYKATNYNPVTGVWTDSSGNSDNATAPGGSAPTLSGGLTPNGSAAVVFNGSQFLNIATPVSHDSGADGFTVFAFEHSNNNGNSKTIVSGGTNGGAFQYRIGGDGNGEVQEVLRQGQANLGHSNTLLGTAFHSINVSANSTSAAFRLDGSADGTAGGSTFGPISQIGNANSGELFIGAIAEIRVYTGSLSPADIAAVEASFTQAYVTPVPEPASVARANAFQLPHFSSFSR